MIEDENRDGRDEKKSLRNRETKAGQRKTEQDLQARQKNLRFFFVCK